MAHKFKFGETVIIPWGSLRFVARCERFMARPMTGT